MEKNKNKINKIVIALTILIYIVVIFLNYHVYALIVNIFYLNAILAISLFSLFLLDKANKKIYIIIV